MSYEGYTVEVCEDGHLNKTWESVWEHGEGGIKCKCGKKIVDFGSVDETNGLPYSLNFHLEVIEEQVTETCPTCNHCHVKSPRRVRMIKHVDWGYNESGDLFEPPLDQYGDPIPVLTGK